MDEKKPVKIFTLDTETRGLNGEIFRIGLYSSDCYLVALSFNEIYESLLHFSRNFEIHVYIHNLDFDLSKIAKLIKQDIKFKNSLYINNRAVTVVTENIIFHDSFVLLGNGSLQSLCEDFGLSEKGKMDVTLELLKKQRSEFLVWKVFKHKKVYDRDRGEVTDQLLNIIPQLDKKATLNRFFNDVDPLDPLLNDYLKMDCSSLYELIMIVKNLSGLDLETFVLCPTIASLSMKIFKTKNESDFEVACQKKWLGSSEVDELFLRRGYFGGRTEVFKPILTEGYHYDVVSLYPYVMKSNEFPVGKWFYKSEGKKALTTFNIWRRTQKGAGFLHCKVEIPKMNIPPLPIRSAQLKKLCFPYGLITGVWTYHELNMAIEEGCKILEVFESFYWKETDDIFTNYIRHWEETKNTSKGAKRQFAKLMLNSLYGKFGMIRDRINYTDYNEEEIQQLQKKDIPFDVVNFPLLDKKVIRHEKKLKSDYIQVHLSAYVTSFARMYLYKFMREVEKLGGNIYYCDTDSIVTDIKLEDHFPDLVGGKKFGNWEREKEVEKGFFIAPKMYWEGEKDQTETIKGKGIPKDELENWNRDFYEFMVDMIKDEKMESIPIYKHKPSRQKFITALKTNTDFDRVVLLSKTINLQAQQKRIMNFEENRSDPHYLEIDEEDLTTYFEEVKKQNKKTLEEYSDFYDVVQGIKQHGYIRCITKGEKYYSEYKQFSRSVIRRFFRVEGIPLDVFADCIGYDENLLIDDFRHA